MITSMLKSKTFLPRVVWCNVSIAGAILNPNLLLADSLHLWRRCMTLVMCLKTWVRSLWDDSRHLLGRRRSHSPIPTVHVGLKICSHALSSQFTEQRPIHILVDSSRRIESCLTVSWRFAQSHCSSAFSCTAYWSSSAELGLCVPPPSSSRSICHEAAHSVFWLFRFSALFLHWNLYQG